MKLNNFFAVILLGAMVLPATSIKADMQQDWQVKVRQAMPYLLSLYSIYFVTDQMSNRICVYLAKYEQLMRNKTSQEQLQILIAAKASVNKYRSPLEYKVLSDLIVLYNKTYQSCLGLIEGMQDADEQEKKLVEYREGLWAHGYSFLTYWYRLNGYISAVDREFVNGFIKQIEEN